MYAQLVLADGAGNDRRVWFSHDGHKMPTQNAVAEYRRFGLPINAAYYNDDQYLSPPPPPLPLHPQPPKLLKTKKPPPPRFSMIETNIRPDQRPAFAGKRGTLRASAET
jgi:hypothetical protein